MPSTKTNNQDLDAHSDSGSTISLASCGSALSGLTPKPPLDGTFRSKSAKGKRSKVAQSTHSPYASRQVTAKRTEATNSNTRNLWLTSMKNGTATLSTNNTAMNTWAGPRPSHAKKRQPGSRTRNFSDVVEFSNNRTKSHSRSATLSYAEPQVIGGGPALKPAEDYYDEIIELKKVINSLKEDNNLLSTKLHRVEEENIMKDRKMDDLLNSRKQPEDLRRTLTDKRGDTSSIVNSLKQKLHAVERTVKEKETELSNLRKDLKMTDTEELRIQSETYYQEIQRLQLAMLQMQQESINYQYSSSRVDLDMSDEITSARGKRPISAPQQRLQRDVEMLKAENRSLKKDLISAVESQSKKSNKKSLNVGYADMSRGQLLHTIHELELKLDECKSRTKDSAKEKDEHDEKKDLKKRKFTESEDKLNRLEENQAELLEEREKLRNTIERLKEDRTHYRNVADDLRKQLKAKEEEVEDLQHKLSQISTTTGAAVTMTTSSTMKRKSSTGSTSSHSSTKRQSFTARERDLQMEKEFEEFKQRHAAKVLQKQWRSYQGKKHVRKEMEEQEKQRQEAAAKTLQREWKKHLMQKDKALQDEAITDIQAAFRGHLVREDKLGKSRSELVDSDDAIISVQSAMRGHLTRSKSQEQLEDEWSHDKSHDSNERISQELSDDDDDDDIVIIRSSHYENKSPFSSKKRSSFTAATVSPSLTPPQPTPRTRSPPHPAPRTLKGLDTTPPSPAPRHKVPTPEVLPQSESAISDDDSDDDNVVIGGSSVAHTAQSSDNSSEPKQMKQNSKQNNQSDSMPTATVKERQSSSCIQSNMDIQLSDQVFNETESDSDNDLVVCGKTATNTRMTESKEKKNSKYEHQEMSNEKRSVALSNEDTSSSSLTNEKPLFVLSHENASNFSRNEKPLKSSTNNTMSNSSSEIDKKPSSLLANENPYLGLTSGNLSNVPEITRNRVFKGIKWSQTNDDIKQKEKITAEDKTNPENENQLDEKDETEMKKELEQSKTVVNSKCNPEIVSPKNIPCDQKISSNQASCDSVTPHDLNISHDNVSVDEHTTLHDPTVSNEGQVSLYTTKPHQEKKDSKDDKGVKESTFDTSSSGLTKNINPQRTIAELSEESDDKVVTSWRQSQMRTNDFQKTKSSSAKKTTQIQHEIIDSDDHDDDEVVVSSTKGRSSMISKTYRNSDSSARKTSLRESEGRKMNQGLTKVRKTSSRELHDSDEESDDDVVVTSSKKNKQKATFSPRPSYSKNTASPTKRESLVDHLLIPKRPPRTSEDIRTGKSLLRGDDEDDEDDDNDDDNIIVGSWRNKSKKSEESSLKKDSLSSLWSGSSKQNKKGSSGFGFGSFENLSSSSRHADSNLDELF